MSDVSQGPGWWKASDGKWYPAETHPGAGTELGSLPYASSKSSSGGFFGTHRAAKIVGIVVAVFVLLGIIGAAAGKKKTTLGASPAVATSLVVPTTSAPTSAPTTAVPPVTSPPVTSPPVTSPPATSPPPTSPPVATGPCVVSCQGDSGNVPAEAFGAFDVCKQFVTDRLKAPSGATWRDPIGNQVTYTGSGKGPWTVNASVDSQNSFGAKLRSTYSCTVTNTGGDSWHLDNLIFNDGGGQ